MVILIWISAIVAFVLGVNCMRRFIPYAEADKEYQEKYHPDDSCSHPTEPPPGFLENRKGLYIKFLDSVKMVSVAAILLFALVFVRLFFENRVIFFYFLSAIDFVLFGYFALDYFEIGKKINFLQNLKIRDIEKGKEKQRDIESMERRKNLNLALAIIFAVISPFLAF